MLKLFGASVPQIVARGPLGGVVIRIINIINHSRFTLYTNADDYSVILLKLECGNRANNGIGSETTFQRRFKIYLDEKYYTAEENSDRYFCTNPFVADEKKNSTL